MNTLGSENRNQQHLSKADFEKLSDNEKIDLFVQGYRVPQKQSNAATLEMIRRKMEQQNTSAPNPSRSLRIYWPVAASVALIALLSAVYFYLAPAQQQTLDVNKGQHLEFTLPDGSEIKVNADSKVTYSEAKFNRKRELELTGEAFFSVKKGNPFVVKTPVGSVEVLGTTLNVFARGRELNVSCLTGKVKVTVGKQSVVILPGEKVAWKDGALIKSPVSSEGKEAGWVKGEFNFDNIPLISIFDEIERQFNVKISAKGIEDRYYTGSFSNTKLTEVLETVCLPMNLDYEIKDGNKISIKPKAR